MNRPFTYLLLSLSLACSSPRQETATQQAESNQRDSALLANATSVPALGPLKIQLFNSVAQTRKKLSSVGVGAMGNWHYDGSGWISLSPYDQFGAPGIDKLRNNVILSIESSRKNEVQTMKVKVNIPNMNQKSRSLSRYVSTVTNAFAAIGQPIPEDLTRALWKGKPYQKETETLSIENRLEQGRYTSWILIVSSF